MSHKRWSPVHRRYLPEGYWISDAENLDTLKIIEYSNLSGTRIAFYQYGSNANIRIDIETATREVKIKDQATGYIFVKAESKSTALYWSDGGNIFAVAYDSDQIKESEIIKIAASLQWV